MILGGKLPGKVGRCRFYFFFVLQTGSVSTFRKYAFPDGIGFAARMKSVKLGALVIWTLPVFYYLDLYNRDKKLSTH